MCDVVTLGAIPRPHEVYPLPFERMQKIFGRWKIYDIIFVIDDIIKYYVQNEEEIIRNLFETYAFHSLPGLRRNLMASIRELNGMQSDYIGIRERTIKIPLNIEFFRMAFPEYKLMESGPMKISTDIGVLKELSYSQTLEEVVRETIQPEGIDAEGYMEINFALHRMKIYSCPDAEKEKLTTATTNGIKIFQNEHMDKQQPKRIYSSLGAICKETVKAMNQALKDGWTSELYFYCKIEGSESYVHDFVINNAGYVDTDVEIFAKERGQEGETFLGKKKPYPYRGTTYYGIQRFATLHFYSRCNTTTEKIIYAIAKNEGGDPSTDSNGGFDTINAYDHVALSVGLYHWNRDWLFVLLEIFRNISENDFNILIKEHGLDIDWMNYRNERVRAFKIDGVNHPRNIPEALRKLRFVYRFIKAAENVNFQEAQEQYAGEWVERNSTMNGQLKSGRKVSDYVTSQYAVALLVDMYVKAGAGATSTQIELAVNSVLRQAGIQDNPGSWGDNEEGKIIIAIRDTRTRSMDPLGERETRIKAMNLSQRRRSFR